MVVALAALSMQFVYPRTMIYCREYLLLAIAAFRKLFSI